MKSYPLDHDRSVSDPGGSKPLWSSKKRFPIKALFAGFISCQAAAAEPTNSEVKLLFSGAEDVAATWGKLHFGATAMQKVRDGASPGFVPACFLPGQDGQWAVYGQIWKPDATNAWKLVRATTRDGVHFENLETVFTMPSGTRRWTEHLGLAFNPVRKEFLALKLRCDPDAFAYRAFFSPDGRNWTENPDTLFFDGDSLGLFWSPAAGRFICTTKTLQPFAKHIQDHGAKHPQLHDDNLRERRVQVIRSSPDGRLWEPSDSMVGINGDPARPYRSVPTKFITAPDAEDPPEMEFYRAIGFWHHDRAYMVVLNYAASPLTPGKHGPQLDTEWWTSREGLHWERPARGLNALGVAFPSFPNITHNPLIVDGMMLFYMGDKVYGLRQDRFSYVGARANAEFSTRPFTMPQGDLFLNAAVPSVDRPFAIMLQPPDDKIQSYVMAAVWDEGGRVIPGFEAGKCVITNRNDIEIPLRWENRSARELAGRKISLRLFLRSADIYAVTSTSGAVGTGYLLSP